MMHVTNPLLPTLLAALLLWPTLSSAQTADADTDAPAAADVQDAAPAPDATPEQAPAPDAAPEPPAAPPAPPLLGVGQGLPVSTDPGMYPPLRSPADPRPLMELHGFTALWVVPHTNDDAPQRSTETFRLRWAILRFDAHPTRNLHVVTRLGFMTDPVLLDASVTWSELAPLNVTFGQFRMPVGAAATTLAPQLVMLDRPGYVYSMTKATFRDVGVMLHSGNGGLANGLLHYRLAVASGNGRVTIAEPLRAETAQDLMWTGRVIVDAGPRIAPGTRLALGGTMAFTRDPALDITDLPAARRTAANLLGRTWVPLGQERDTLLSGADVTFSQGPVWVQAEWMRLNSAPTSGADPRRSMGTSLELAYKLPWTVNDTAFQLAARGERTDPDLDTDDDDFTVAAFGVNVLPSSPIRVSAFGQATFYADPVTGDASVGSEVQLRGTLAF